LRKFLNLRKVVEAGLINNIHKSLARMEGTLLEILKQAGIDKEDLPDQIYS